MKTINSTHKGVNYKIEELEGMTDMDGKKPFKYTIGIDETNIYAYRVQNVIFKVIEEIEENYI